MIQILKKEKQACVVASILSSNYMMPHSGFHLLPPLNHPLKNAKLQASFSSKYKLDIAWSQATVFCQGKMTLNSHFSVFFVMFTQSLRALKRPFVSLRPQGQFLF